MRRCSNCGAEVPCSEPENVSLADETHGGFVTDFTGVKVELPTGWRLVTLRVGRGTIRDLSGEAED